MKNNLKIKQTKVGGFLIAFSVYLLLLVIVFRIAQWDLLFAIPAALFVLATMINHGYHRFRSKGESTGDNTTTTDPVKEGGD